MRETQYQLVNVMCATKAIASSALTQWSPILLWDIYYPACFRFISNRTVTKQLKLITSLVQIQNERKRSTYIPLHFNSVNKIKDFVPATNISILRTFTLPNL